MPRELRGKRYLTPRNELLANYILNDLPYLDFEETLRWYAEVTPTLALTDRALLGCNDRYYLLTALCGRRDALHPWLFDRCREVEKDPDGYIDLWFRFGYKAVQMDEPIPTPLGWRKHGDLVPGDQVYGPDGKPCCVIAKTPVFNNADCYRVVFDDGYSVVVSGDHLWTVDKFSKARVKGNTRDGSKTVTISTKELLNEVRLSQNSSSRIFPRIPLAQPVERPHQDLPLDPFLLGVWLGDGSLGGSRITSGFEDVDAMEANLRATGIEVRRSSHSNSVSLSLGSGRRGNRSSSDFTNALRQCGVYRHKHIPAQYFMASAAQRWALLQGLMDTDGSCTKSGRCIFCAANSELAQHVFDLCQSLGLKATIAERSGLYKGKSRVYWQVGFQSNAARPPFRLARKAMACRSAGRPYRKIIDVQSVAARPVSCIQIDRADGLYLIGRNYITTHNSTIITFAGLIQEVLCDPEIKIAIFSVVKAIANAFLSQIKDEFESNEHLKETYPDVLYENPKGKGPDGRPAKWGVMRGITVKRKGNPKEATIEAHGLIDGQPTSRHFDLHDYDDVVTVDYLSDEQIKKTTARWEMADNLGSHLGVRKWCVGTRYHYADTYGTIIERKSLKARVYPATDNGKLDGKPVFLSKERWEEIKRDQRSVVSAQMLLNPIAGNEATFQSIWLQTYDIIPALMNVYILVDPSKGTGDRSDRTAISVIGIDQGSNKYLLDGVRHRMKLSDRWAFVKQMKERWESHPGVQMVKVGWERYGKDVELEVIEDMMLRENKQFLIEELNTPRQGGHSKDDRIERLEPDIRGGRFYLPCVAYHPDYVHQHKEAAGVCYWHVWTPERDRTAADKGIKHTYSIGQIIYVPMQGLTKRQQNSAVTAQSHRIVKALKRRDENGDIYDLTRAFIDEAIRHPFATHDDLIDSVSRIYDIDPQPPMNYEAKSTEPFDLDKDETMGTDIDEVVKYDPSHGGSMGRTF